jgi:hypothetical protein
MAISKKPPTDDEARVAVAELHPGIPPGGPTLMFALGDEVWQRWIEEVRTNPAYHLRNPDDPSDAGRTGSAGGNPMPALIVEYGPGQHQYISTVFDAGQAIVQDGSDPTGKAWKFPEENWRRFVARVRGEDLPDDEKPQGPTMHEAAAEQNARTFGRAAFEREHGVPEATGAPGADESAAKPGGTQGKSGGAAKTSTKG